jgi:hypothetical protein
MPIKRPRLTQYSANAGTTNPNDSTAYYFGSQNLQLTTAASANRIHILKGGRIRAAIVNAYTGVTGSAENVIWYLRKNNTTDYQIDAGHSMNVENQLWVNYNLDIPVIAGDYIIFKCTTPAWAANPTSINFNGRFLVESP